MRRLINNNRWNIGYVLWGALLISVLAACNKNFNNPLTRTYVDPATPSSYGSNKILYLTIDGANGNTLKVLAPPVLTALSSNALYAWNSLADDSTETMNNATGWANEMTGVTPKQHGILSNDFAGSHLDKYPSIVSLLKQTKPGLRVAAFSSSMAFSSHFTADATVSTTFENDDAKVRDAVVSELASSDPAVVIGQFHSVDAVGAVSGYADTNPAYKTAVLNIDQYIGTILQAMKARKNYANENWLVIINANKGGIPSGPAMGHSSPFNDPDRNTFTFFYNPKFSTSFIPQPLLTDVKFNSFASRFVYSGSTYPIATNQSNSLGNLDGLSSFTIQLQVKNAATKMTSNLNPALLSKRAENLKGNGWHVLLREKGWGFSSALTSSDLQATQSTINLMDNIWHTLTVTLTKSGSITTIKLFTDGALSLTANATSPTASLNTTFPMIIGKRTGSSSSDPSVLVANVQIYKTAFNDADVAQYSCQTVIDQTDPYYNNLLGYWPCDEQGKTVLKERTGLSGSGNDFVLSGSYTWENFNDYSPNLCPPPPVTFYQSIPNGRDIPVQMFLWLGLTPDVNWGWSGRGWTPVYTSIKP